MANDAAGAGAAPATKDDLQAVRRELALEIIRLRAQTERMFDDQREEIRARSSDLTEKIEKFMTEVGKTDRAQIIADWRLSQLEKRVAAIEPRPS